MGVKNEETVDSSLLVGPMKYKQTREERLKSIMEGREGREKFGSRRGKRENAHSTTNREKAVSYTHLDVYKRQLYRTRCVSPNM